MNVSTVKVRRWNQVTSSKRVIPVRVLGKLSASPGTEIEVDTVDGPVRMKVPAGTQSGSDFKLSGHGVPHIKNDNRGAHIVTLIVDTPTKLSKQQAELLQS